MISDVSFAGWQVRDSMVGHPETSPRDDDADLEQRIAVARDRHAPREAQVVPPARGEAAWRMVIELVVGVAIGTGVGYGLDQLFGTLPVLLVAGTLLGFAAGVRTMLRTADTVGRAKSPAFETGNGPALHGIDEPTAGALGARSYPDPASRRG